MGAAKAGSTGARRVTAAPRAKTARSTAATDQRTQSTTDVPDRETGVLTVSAGDGSGKPALLHAPHTSDVQLAGGGARGGTDKRPTRKQITAAAYDHKEPGMGELEPHVAT